MICKVIETIEKHKMLDGVRTVAVGLSGGADSMCLTDVLIKLQMHYDIVIKAVHINHNIRGVEADRDALHVKNYCDKKGIELLLFDVDIPTLSKEMGISEEECGRKVRYDCFEKAGCDVIATAHTLSDSVETVLFNLARGTGTKGLTGIPPVRTPGVIRPLIDCTRTEIEEYCRTNNIKFVTDSTNLTDDYKRNFIRHKIIPSLSEINLSVVKSIASTAEILRDENNFIEQCANDLLKNSFLENGYSTEKFLSAHPAVRKRALRILLGEKMTKSVEQKHIKLLEDAIISKKGKVQLSEDLYISVDSDIIHFCNNEICFDAWFDEVRDNSFLSPYSSYKLVQSSDVNGIDTDKIKGKLIASSRMAGDRIYLKKRKITKSLKKAFNEMKIPAFQRNVYAVLRDGENIVWVEGIGTDGKYLPDENSKNVVSIIKEVSNRDK